VSFEIEPSIHAVSSHHVTPRDVSRLLFATREVTGSTPVRSTRNQAVSGIRHILVVPLTCPKRDHSRGRSHSAEDVFEVRPGVACGWRRSVRCPECQARPCGSGSVEHAASITPARLRDECVDLVSKWSARTDRSSLEEVPGGEAVSLAPHHNGGRHE
jgi:hypothetical protein